jgi:hypothetical protein
MEKEVSAVPPVYHHMNTITCEPLRYSRKGKRKLKWHFNSRKIFKRSHVHDNLPHLVAF